MKNIKILILLLLAATIIFIFNPLMALSEAGEKNEWSFLNTTAIGAKQFIDQNPAYDGRGQVIFILDSGVDMGVPGLLKTSTGETKVIDVRDFSGQGDVALYPGKEGSQGNEKFIEHPDGFRLYNYHLLQEFPVEGEYLIGYLDEIRFKNSQVYDINNNGRYDDVFGVLVFEKENADTLYWVAYVDTDGDLHLEDEKPMRDYRVNFDSFQLRGGNERYDRSLMTFGINILPYDMKVSFHFDDDGHGTHVAGTAAGYEIHGQSGYNGVAPGSRVISLKIGSGIYDGGCTVSGSLRKALSFIEDYTFTHQSTVIVNISYGIGSIREGQSDADRLINNLLTYNDNIFVVVSNGNDGPGISTTGTPAAAKLAFSVGACLPAADANELFGAKLKTNKIFEFSARGGELNKPDAIAPGAASSTVPNFTDNDFMRGTSMAAPQAAGAAALLLSGCAYIFPEQKITGQKIKKALKFSAQPLKGYSFLDQGNGVINVPEAFLLLKSMNNFGEKNQVIEYEIETDCPTSENGEAEAAYWRTSGYFPGNSQQQVFRVKPILHDSLEADERANFYRSYYLKSSAPWLKPVKKAVYIKGEQPAEIAVRYNEKLMEQPGMYCGKITAIRKGRGFAKSDSNAEFELLNTVIVPYVFDSNNKYQQVFEKQSIDPGDVDRYFILVPPGATAAKIILEPVKGKFCHIQSSLFTPEGNKFYETSPVKSLNEKGNIQIVAEKDVEQGVWELDVWSDFRQTKSSFYDLKILFNGFRIEPPVITDYVYALGKEPHGQLSVINQFVTPFYGFGRGEISGYRKVRKKIVKNTDTFSYNFSPEPGIHKVEFVFDFTEDSFLKMSDVAVNIYNSRGKSVARNALSFNRGKIELSYIKDEFYTLELVAASVYPDYDQSWEFIFTEKYYVTDQVKIKVYSGSDRLFYLYPSIQKKMEFTMDKSPRIAPEGFCMFGELRFLDRNYLRQEFSVPILFK